MFFVGHVYPPILLSIAVDEVLTVPCQQGATCPICASYVAVFLWALQTHEVGMPRALVAKACFLGCPPVRSRSAAECDLHFALTPRNSYSTAFKPVSLLFGHQCFVL